MPPVAREPDILIRTAPALNATSDAPLAEVQRPPESASNNAADHARGTSEEISASDLAAATAARQGADPDADPDADPKPAADGLRVDATEADSDIDPKLPGWAKREIREERRKAKEYREAVDAAAKTAIGSPEWEKAINLSRDQLIHKEREAVKAAGKEAREAREAAEAARKELDELKAKGTPAAEEKPAEDPRPTRHDFDDPDLYDEAMVEWGKREGVRATEVAAAEKRTADEAAENERLLVEAQAEHDAEVTRVNTEWQNRREAAIEKYPDYVDVAEAKTEDGGPVITEVMAVSIMQADNGADVAYYLGQNTEEAERISKIRNPAKQIMEMGRLVERLSNPPRRAAPRQRPIEPIDSGSNTADESDRELTMEEYAAKRMPQLNAARKPFFPPSQMH